MADHFLLLGVALGAVGGKMGIGGGLIAIRCWPGCTAWTSVPHDANPGARRRDGAGDPGRGGRAGDVRARRQFDWTVGILSVSWVSRWRMQWRRAWLFCLVLFGTAVASLVQH